MFCKFNNNNNNNNNNKTLMFITILFSKKNLCKI